MELPRTETGVNRKKKWIAADGRSYATRKEAIIAQLGLPEAPPEPPRLGVGLPRTWYVNDRAFDSMTEAFGAYRESRNNYFSNLGKALGNLSNLSDYDKEQIICEMTGRELRDCVLALRLRGNDVQAAVKWLFENQDYSYSRTEMMLIYGFLAGYVLHLCLIISYISSLAANYGTRMAMELSRPRAPNGFFDWFQDQFILSYTDQASSLVRKIIFTAPQSGLVAIGLSLILMAVYLFIGKRTDLLVFKEPWADIVPATVGFVSIFGLLTCQWGGSGMLDHGVSLIRSIL